MSPVWRRLLLLFAIAVAVFAVFSIRADVGKLGDRLQQVAPGAVVAALALALGNYAIRWVRWEAYLRSVGARVPARASVLVFVAGFAMSVTPGKVGELVKAALLRDAAGVPAARTAPVVVAERVTDLVALVLLGLAGVAAYGVAAPMVAAAAVVVFVGLAILSFRPMAHTLIDALGRLGPLRRLAPRIRAFYDDLADLVRPAPLTWATALAVAAWLCECVGFALIVRAFPGAEVSLGLATLIYAATTVAGALSFLPGGLVVTEGAMMFLLAQSARGVDQATAVGATILIRLCTLWFAVLLGLIALAALRRLGRIGAPRGP